MKLTSYFSSLLTFSAFVYAIPVSQGASALIPRAECDDGTYGEQITLKEYEDYLKKYYPETNKYMLYSAKSDNQCVNFQQNNAGYFWFNDFFHYKVSEHYTTAFPPHPDHPDCWREDDGDAQSAAIANVATADILVFGAVEWQAEGRTSWFATKEVPGLQAGIRAGRLSKITHMLRDATKKEEILATEDADENITFTDGHDGEKNASGVFGDCSSTTDPPTCDNPNEGNDH